MGIVNKLVPNSNIKPQPQESSQLTSSELEYLLSILRATTLTGDQVEAFYNLAVKLQKQYLEMNK
jgi:hypothetical protein